MSRLEDAIAAGRFAVTAELLTIDAGGLEAVRERFAPYEDWVDAVNATDNTSAHAHASPLAVAIALKQLGVEPVMQLTCRDRNRLALEADIAGAGLHGIENICCLTGDDVTAGDEPEAPPVFDLDSVQLLATARAMAGGRHPPRRPVEPPPPPLPRAVQEPPRPATGGWRACTWSVPGEGGGSPASAASSPSPHASKGNRVVTELRSRSRTVLIGPEQPFCIIGERINPTGRKAFQAQLQNGDLSQIELDVAEQGAANMLDVNVGDPLADEVGLMAQAIPLVQSLTEQPLCIDSSVIEALEAGLAAYEGKALVNSVTGEDERLETILPLVAKHGAAVIGLANDDEIRIEPEDR